VQDTIYLHPSAALCEISTLEHQFQVVTASHSLFYLTQGCILGILQFPPINCFVAPFIPVVDCGFYPGRIDMQQEESDSSHVFVSGYFKLVSPSPPLLPTTIMHIIRLNLTPHSYSVAKTAKSASTLIVILNSVRYGAGRGGFSLTGPALTPGRGLYFISPTRPSRGGAPPGAWGGAGI